MNFHISKYDSPSSTLIYLLLYFFHDIRSCNRILTFFLFNTGRVIHSSFLKTISLKLLSMPHTPLGGRWCCAEGRPTHSHTASCFAPSWSASSLWCLRRCVSFTCNNILVRENTYVDTNSKQQRSIILNT